MSNMKKPVALIIMDGFGNGEKNNGNAIFDAKKPNPVSYTH